MVMNPTVIFVVIVLLMCHAQISLSRPESSASLDTSVFELEDYEYHYDSDPYFPSSQAENNKNMGMKEAKMVDPWTLDFRRKLANRENIGKKHDTQYTRACKLTTTIRKKYFLLQIFTT